MTAPESIRGFIFKEQSEWSLDDWRNYAKYLEKEGVKLASDLHKIETALIHKIQQSSRSKKPAKYNRASILSGEQPKGKSGRKKSAYLESRELALQSHQKQLMFERDGRSIAAREALGMVCEELGYPEDKVTRISGSRHIHNLISQIRSQKN